MFKLARLFVVPALAALAFFIAWVASAPAGPTAVVRPLIDSAKLTQTTLSTHPQIDSAVLMQTASGLYYAVNGSEIHPRVAQESMSTAVECNKMRFKKTLGRTAKPSGG